MARKTTGTTKATKASKSARPAPKKPVRKKAARAAAAPEGAGGRGQLRIKQVRSGIGHPETYRLTLRALGLRHHQDEVVLADTPSTRGMVRKVWHFVRVQSVEA